MSEFKVGDRVADVDYDPEDPGTVIAVDETGSFLWVRFDSSDGHDRPASLRVTEVVRPKDEMLLKLLEACDDVLYQLSPMFRDDVVRLQAAKEYLERVKS